LDAQLVAEGQPNNVMTDASVAIEIADATTASSTGTRRKSPPQQ